MAGLVKRGWGRVRAFAGAVRLGQYLSAFRPPWDVPAPGARARGFHTVMEPTSPSLGNHLAILCQSISTKFTALANLGSLAGHVNGGLPQKEAL